MSKSFQIPDSILPQALAAYEKGEKDFSAFAAVASGMFGHKDSATFVAAFHKVRAEAKRNADFATLAEKVGAYKVPKSLATLVKLGQAFVTAHSVAEEKEGDTVKVPGFTPRVVFTVEYDAEKDTATVSVTQGKVTTRASKGDKPGSNSRVSAYTAWKRGAKSGDSFKVVKVDGGYKVDGRFVPSRANGGLAAFVLKVHPTTKTAEILKQYGYGE